MSYNYHFRYLYLFKHDLTWLNIWVLFKNLHSFKFIHFIGIVHLSISQALKCIVHRPNWSNFHEIFTVASTVTAEHASAEREHTLSHCTAISWIRSSHACDMCMLFDSLSPSRTHTRRLHFEWRSGGGARAEIQTKCSTHTHTLLANAVANID